MNGMFKFLHSKTFITIQVFNNNQFCFIVIIIRMPMYSGVYMQKGYMVNNFVDVWYWLRIQDELHL